MRDPIDPAIAHYSGGSFYQDAISARSSIRTTYDGATRSVVVGLRLCADPAIPRQ
jgi:formylglycine-generating enzyme required for sulfatase activity